MKRQRSSGHAHLLLKGLRKLHSAAFGFDERQVAIVSSDAGYQTPHKGGGARRKFLEQRLVRERCCAVRRDIRTDSVLPRRQSDFAVAVCSIAFFQNSPASKRVFEGKTNSGGIESGAWQSWRNIGGNGSSTGHRSPREN